MQLPNLPTDNLYKFIALSGVFILITLLVLLNLSKSRILIEIDEIETEEGELVFEMELKNLRTEEIGNELKILRERVDEYKRKGYIESDNDINSLLKKLKDSEEREYYQFLYKYEEKILPEIFTLNVIEAKCDELFELQNKTRLNKMQVNRKRELIRSKYRRLKQDIWKYYLGIIISLIISIYGFVLWYKRVQIYLDLKLKNEITKLNNALTNGGSA